MKLISQVLIVAAGGAIGTTLRMLVYYLTERQLPHFLPFGTIFVNIIGSLFIGILWAVFEKSGLSPTLRAFVFIGVLGGFTTFSSFSLDSFNILSQGKFQIFLLYFGLNNLLGIGACFLGYYSLKMFH